MEFPVYDIEANKTGDQASLADGLFAQEPNDHAIYLEVKRYLAAQRQGTHATKGRSQVKGSTKKLRRQKGTGAARVGDIKNPLFRGGGRMFGPQVRDYSLKLNKKVSRLARSSAFRYKANDERIHVLNHPQLDQPRTKPFAEFIATLTENKGPVLILMAVNDQLVYRSVRNLPRVEAMPARQVNTYALMKAQYIVLLDNGIEELNALAN